MAIQRKPVSHVLDLVVLGLLLLVVVAVAVMVGCTDQNVFVLSGPSGGVGGGVLSSAIENLRIEPSQFEMTNGQQGIAVVVGSVGGVEVRDFDFIPSIIPNSSVATIIQVAGNTIVFKAENVGHTNLRVVAGASEAEASIRVEAAN